MLSCSSVPVARPATLPRRPRVLTDIHIVILRPTCVDLSGAEGGPKEDWRLMVSGSESNGAGCRTLRLKSSGVLDGRPAVREELPANFGDSNLLFWRSKSNYDDRPELPTTTAM